ncbi:MAG: sigma factor-like helix-turn-helix DNA-binding protein, partial [Acidimicrobiales bacterium]|nr:sigma factor-like helix-turn-helix DNA-binding protein [Acidimicrobiales bacterium]
LPPDPRQAFVLTQMLGFSYADAATTMGCAIGTIRSRVFRARATLVDAWNEGLDTTAEEACE